MLKLIEISHYRCLKYCQQPLQNAHLLLGPNASGKSTFLDVVAFLRDIISPGGGLLPAIEKRTTIPESLLWNQSGEECGFAVECDVPSRIAGSSNGKKILRYEITIQVKPVPAIKKETLAFMEKSNLKTTMQRTLFPLPDLQYRSVHANIKDKQSILSRSINGNANYYPEGGKGFKPSLKIDSTFSGLLTIPDPKKFPAAIWFREFLQKGILNLSLNSEQMRLPSPPAQSGERLMPTGGNLPRVVENLKNKNKAKFVSWIEHISTGLPEIKNVEVVERGEDKYKYLVVEHHSGLKIPSWLVSDGTLRMLALTLPAYYSFDDSFGIYLLEEPENGVHPKVMDVITRSLRNISNGRVFIASHSPVILNLWKDKMGEILCFAKNAEGATDVVSGADHPQLKKYLDSKLSIEDLYCSGVLG